MNHFITQGRRSFQSSFLLCLALLLVSASLSAQTYYSALGPPSNSWSSPTTWTTDPSGAGFAGFGIPTAGPGERGVAGDGTLADKVVILSGGIVNVDVNNIQAAEIEVRAGGVLNLLTSTGHTITTISGAGTIRVGSFTLPTVTTASFLTAGTIEYAGPGGNIPQNPFGGGNNYYNLRLSGTTANTKVQNTGLVVNGDLTIDSACTFQIGNDANNRILNIGGDFIVASSCTPANLTAVTVANAQNTGYNATDAPSAHTVFIAGDLRNLSSNESVIYFLNAADATKFPSGVPTQTQVWAANGMATVVFNNTIADQQVQCNAPIYFEQFQMDKGTDDTYVLEFIADATANFRLLGHTDGAQTGPDGSFDLSTFATDLRAGTLKLGNNIIIELNQTPGDGSGGGVFVDTDVTLWINGATVNHTRERIRLYGGLQISNGSLTIGNANGLVYRESCKFIMSGGTFNARQMRPTTATGHEGSFTISGGVINLLGNNPGAQYPRLCIPYPNQTFTMTGGTFNISNEDLDPIDQVNPVALQDSAWGMAIDIRVAEGNYTVTGGTWNLQFQNQANERDMAVNSTVPFWDFNVVRTSGTAGVNFGSSLPGFTGGNQNIPNAADNDTLFFRKMVVYDFNNGPPADFQQPVRVLSSMTVGANTIVYMMPQEAPQLSIQRNLTIDALGVLEMGTAGKLTFNGAEKSTFTLSGTTGTFALPKFSLEKSVSTGLLSLASTGRTVVATDTNSVFMRVSDSLRVLSGQLDYAGFRVEALGTVENLGIIGLQGTAGRLLVKGTAQQTIVASAAGNTSFGHLQLANASANPSVVLAGGAIDSVRQLSMSATSNGIFDIGTYNVTSFARITFNGSAVSATKHIRLAGNASDGGLTLYLNSAAAAVYPIGTNANSVYRYTPATATPAASTTGYLTIRPVDQLLGTMNNVAGNTNQALTYYWRVTNSGFSVAPNVTYAFTNDASDVPGGATVASWEPGSVLDANPFTRTEYTTGDFTTNVTTTSSHALINANYTAGFSIASGTPKFQGAPKIYFSRNVGPVEWTNTNCWSSNTVISGWNESFFANGVNYGVDGGIPTANDVVYIGYSFEGGTSYECHTVFHQVNSAISAAEVIFSPIPNFDLDGAPEWADRAFLEIRNGTFPTGQIINFSRVSGSRGVFAVGVYSNGAIPTITGVDFGSFATGSENIFLFQPMSTNNAAPPTHTVPTTYPTVYPTIRSYSGAYEGAILTFTNNITTNFNLELDGGTRLLLNTGATGDFTIGQDLILRTPATDWGSLYPGDATGYSEAQLAFAATGTSRTVDVARDIIFEVSGVVNDHGRIFVDSTTAPALTTPHILRVGRNINQNSPNSFGLRLARSDFNAAAAVELIFDGSDNSTFSRTGGAPARLYGLTINKSALANRVTISNNFVLNPTASGTTKPLTITAGTLEINPPASQNLVLSTGGADFEISENSALRLKNNVTATLINGDGTSPAQQSDLILNGELWVEGNSRLFVLGDSIGTNNTNNRSVASLIYGGNSSTVFAVSGTAYVDIDGHFRRGTLSGVGAIQYRQTGGTVLLGRRVRNNSNARAGQIPTLGLFHIETGSYRHTGGSLIIAQHRNGTYPDFYVTTSTVQDSVVGGTVQFGSPLAKAPNIVDETTTYTINTVLNTILVQASPQYLPSLLTARSGTATATIAVPTNELEVSDINIRGSLTIAANTVFDDGGKNISIWEGNFTNAGTFTSTGTVTFRDADGTANTQTITPTAATTFASLVVNKDLASTGSVSLAGAVSVSNSLQVNAGTLALGANNLTLDGSLVNAQTISGSGIVIMTDAVAPRSTISGTGSISNLRIGTALGVEQLSGATQTITTNLDLLTGKLILTSTATIRLNSATTITNAAADRFVQVDGTISQGGIFRQVVAGALTTSVPIGTISPTDGSDKYTPVTFSGNVSAATSAFLIVKAVDGVVSAATDPTFDNNLSYRWEITQSGTLTFTALTHTYTYAESDVVLDPTTTAPGPFTEADYVSGFLLPGANSWNLGASINTTSNVLTYNNFLSVPGTYTAGVNAAAPRTELGAIATYYSREGLPVDSVFAAGPIVGASYQLATNWSTDIILQHTGAAAANAPDPSTLPTGGAGNVIVRNGHTIRVVTANTEAYSINLNGPTSVMRISGTFGSSLNTVTGTGTLQLEPPSVTANLPSANYTSFIDGTTGGTFAFGGSTNYSIPTVLDTVRNMTITGTGTRTMTEPMVLRGNLIINGATLNLNGQNLTVFGDLTISGTGVLDVSGGGTIQLLGSNNQTITGFDATKPLGNVTLAKTGGTLTLGSNLAVSGLLTWSTNQIITPGANTLTFTATGDYTGASATRYVAGEVSKVTDAGSPDFVFPIGTASAYRPVGITNATAGTWSAFPFTSIPTNSSSFAPQASNPATNPILTGIWLGGYWRIIGPNSASANVTVSWTSAVSSGPVSSGDVVVARADDPIAQWFNQGGSGFTGSTLTSGSITTASTPGFSTKFFTVGTQGTPLPVELLAFNGVRRESTTDLRWVTASELNNDRFEIERSVDATSFENVGFVPGNGTTNDQQSYLFTDFDAPDAEYLYYRLRQVDTDGTYAYSPTIELGRDGESANKDNQWSVRPNPTSGDLFELVLIGTGVDFNDTHTVQLVSSTGRVLYQGKGELIVVSRGLRAAIENAQSGAYVLQVTSKGFSQNIRVIRR